MDSLYIEMRKALSDAQTESSKEGSLRYDPNIEKSFLDELCRVAGRRVSKIWKGAEGAEGPDKDVRTRTPDTSSE